MLPAVLLVPALPTLKQISIAAQTSLSPPLLINLLKEILILRLVQYFIILLHVSQMLAPRFLQTARM